MNLAIIGCGHWGMKWIKIFENAGVNVKVCCDISENALKMVNALAPNAILTTDYKSILTDKGIEVVYVATPPSTHYEISKNCLLAEKHVFVEKPMTTNFKSALELIKIAEDKNRILMVGNNYLYNRAIQKIKQLISSGVIGELRHIYLSMTNSLDMWVGKDVCNYVDVLWDLAPHSISIVSYIVGEWPLNVVAFAHNSLNDNFDVASVELYFPSRVTAILHLNWFDYKRDRRILVLGERGAISCEDFSNKESVTINMHKFDFSNKTINLGQTDYLNINVKDTLENEAKDFHRSIFTNSTPINNGKNGAVIVAIIEALHDSIAKYKRIDMGEYYMALGFK